MYLQRVLFIAVIPFVLQISLSFPTHCFIPRQFIFEKKYNCGSRIFRLMGSTDLNHLNENETNDSVNHSTPDNDKDDDEQRKWEHMYTKSQVKQDKTLSIDYSTAQSVSHSTQSCEIRVITFDLDNTLWKTSPVISAANDALDNHLRLDKNLHVPTRIEKWMSILFKQDPIRYAPNDHEVTSTPAAPVYLTQLRKDAIRHVLRDNNISSDEPVEEAFQLWSQARHDAIPHHLSRDVVFYLRKLKQLCTSQGHTLVLGAVTDGNSNPTKIDEFKDIFDFCINAETVGVAKPNKKIYLAALEYVQFHFPHCIPVESSRAQTNPIESLLGPWWVHVGDDFLKDVVASKALHMRSVWYCGLIQNNLDQTKEAVMSSAFLSESIQNDFADDSVTSFETLYLNLCQWHEQGMSTKTDSDT